MYLITLYIYIYVFICLIFTSWACVSKTHIRVRLYVNRDNFTKIHRNRETLIESLIVYMHACMHVRTHICVHGICVYAYYAIHIDRRTTGPSFRSQAAPRWCGLDGLVGLWGSSPRFHSVHAVKCTCMNVRVFYIYACIYEYICTRTLSKSVSIYACLYVNTHIEISL